MSKRTKPGATPETDAVVRRWVDSDQLSVQLTMKCMELEFRLNEALTEVEEQARLVGMGGSREMTLRSQIFELERERDKVQEDARLLSERLTFLELQSTEELARLERERDKAREEVEDLKTRYRSAMMDRDSYRFQAEQKFAMRRELEDLLGIDNGAPGDEQFKKGLKAIVACPKN